MTTPYDVGPQNPAYRLTPLRNVFPRTTGWRYLDWGVSADGYRLVIEHGVIIGLAYDEWPWPWGDARYDAYGRRGVAAQLASRITAMTFPPGWREIPDPEAEVRRLADERLDPPGREWGVQHPGGKVTVQVDGHPFPARITAEKERAACEQDCEWCDGGTHALVMRDRQGWRQP